MEPNPTSARPKPWRERSALADDVESVGRFDGGEVDDMTTAGREGRITRHVVRPILLRAGIATGSSAAVA